MLTGTIVALVIVSFIVGCFVGTAGILYIRYLEMRAKTEYDEQFECSECSGGGGDCRDNVANNATLERSGNGRC